MRGLGSVSRGKTQNAGQGSSVWLRGTVFSRPQQSQGGEGGGIFKAPSQETPWDGKPAGFNLGGGVAWMTGPRARILPLSFFLNTSLAIEVVIYSKISWRNEDRVMPTPLREY
jgi:hypothetical protein